MVHSNGNLLSVLVFFLWVPFALWGARRWPSAKAAALLLLLPLMFLPQRVYFKPPGLPPFEKTEIAILWVFVGVWLFHRHRLQELQLGKWIKLTMFVLIGSVVATVFANFDPVSQGVKYLPGHQPYDAVHKLLQITFTFILPFVLGAAMFNGSKDLKVLLRIFVAAALVYSLFVLVEVRLSPQFHNWVYGFFPHTFRQMVRDGGFRATVFMAHALTVSMFLMVGALGATTLHKAKIKIFRMRAIWAVPYLMLVLVLNKTTGAFVYSLVGVPLILFSTPKTQFRVAAGLAIIVLLYPAMRGAGVVPVEGIKEFALAQFGEERAKSLTTRFDNEEVLLERANERPVFGWGGNGRPGIYDPRYGKQLSIADGDWVITMGQYGFMGFVGKFLLLLLPIFIAARQLKYLSSEADRRLLSALALIVGISGFDMLPNSASHYMTLVFSGALIGCSTGMVRHAALRKRLKRERAAATRLDVEGQSVPA